MSKSINVRRPRYPLPSTAPHRQLAGQTRWRFLSAICPRFDSGEQRRFVGPSRRALPGAIGGCGSGVPARTSGDRSGRETRSILPSGSGPSTSASVGSAASSSVVLARQVGPNRAARAFLVDVASATRRPRGVASSLIGCGCGRNQTGPDCGAELPDDPSENGQRGMPGRASTARAAAKWARVPGPDSGAAAPAIARAVRSQRTSAPASPRKQLDQGHDRVGVGHHRERLNARIGTPALKCLRAIGRGLRDTLAAAGASSSRRTVVFPRFDVFERKQYRRRAARFRGDRPRAARSCRGAWLRAAR